MEENNTNEVKDSVIFFTNQYLIYRYIVIVAESRGFAVRLTDFLVVPRECDEISWDPAKSNQFHTLDISVNFIPGKSISTSFENIIFKIFWGSMPPDPPRTGQKIFLAAARLQLFLARNLTLNYCNKLANMYL